MSRTGGATPTAVHAAVGMMLAHAAACLGLCVAARADLSDAVFYGALAYAGVSVALQLRKRNPHAWWFCRVFGFGGGALMGIGAAVILASIMTGVGPFREPLVRSPLIIGSLLALWITMAAITPVAVAWALSTDAVRSWFWEAPDESGALSA